MRINYQSQKISFDGSAAKHSVKYIKLDSAIGLKLDAVTDLPEQKIPGNINFIGSDLRYYNGSVWIVLKDIRDRLKTTLNKRDATGIGAGDFRSSIDAAYPLPSFHKTVVDSSGYYRPNTVTHSYLTTVGTTPTWKKWTSNSWTNGGDPDSIWGCYINFKIPYIRWSANLTFAGTVRFSYGWNIGFADNQMRVYNVKDPVQNADVTTKAYADAATATIATRTEATIFGPEANINSLHDQLNALYLKAKANTANPNELQTVIDIVRRYQ